MTHAAQTLALFLINANLLGAAVIATIALTGAATRAAPARMRYVGMAMLLVLVLCLSVGLGQAREMLALDIATDVATSAAADASNVFVVVYFLFAALFASRHLAAAYAGAQLASRLRGRTGQTRARSADGPCVVGLLRPLIVMPEAKLSVTEKRWVHRHEHAHAAWRDPLARLALSLISALCWAAPPVKALVKRMIEEQEAAADEAAVRTDTPDARAHYVETLLRFSSHRYAGAAMGVGGAALKRRATRLLSSQRSRGLSILVAGMVFVALVTALTLTPRARASPSGVHLPEDDQIVIHRIIT